MRVKRCSCVRRYMWCCIANTLEKSRFKTRFNAVIHETVSVSWPDIFISRNVVAPHVQAFWSQKNTGEKIASLAITRRWASTRIWKEIWFPHSLAPVSLSRIRYWRALDRSTITAFEFHTSHVPRTVASPCCLSRGFGFRNNIAVLSWICILGLKSRTCTPI